MTCLKGGWVGFVGKTKQHSLKQCKTNINQTKHIEYGGQDEVFACYVNLKQDRQVATRKTEEINKKVEEAETLVKKLNDTMKVFVSEVISEFRAKKA